MGISNLNTAKRLSVKPCKKCGARRANTVVEGLCSVCVRRSVFDNLPDSEKKAMWLAVVPERYIEAKIEDLPQALQKAFNKENDKGILLWGAPGVGKTYAMCALCKKFIAEGFDVKRIHYELLCLQLRDTFKPASHTSELSVIKPLLEADKLFIEDVGTSKSIGQQESDFSLRTFLVLVDMRLEFCRPTFITSNKNVENLGKSFDERIADRLRTYNIFKLDSKSKRD